jgi:hypothetical protein
MIEPRIVCLAPRVVAGDPAEYFLELRFPVHTVSGQSNLSLGAFPGFVDQLLHRAFQRASDA